MNVSCDVILASTNKLPDVSEAVSFIIKDWCET